MDKLERLRTLLATASDRPWEAIVSDSPKYMSTVQFEYLNGTAGTVALVGASNLSQQNTNAELIAEGINALPSLLDEITRLKEEVEEAGQIGERDGYERALQELDQATGGDGEYRYCTDHDPERHCPDADTMKARVVARFAAKQALIDELVEGLVEAKREMWTSARHQWTLGDFKNWAAVQQIDALISKARSSGKAGSDA